MMLSAKVIPVLPRLPAGAELGLASGSPQFYSRVYLLLKIILSFLINQCLLLEIWKNPEKDKKNNPKLPKIIYFGSK